MEGDNEGCPLLRRWRFFWVMVPGYRIWDNKARRWWGDLYELCPDDLLDELNGAKNYDKITALLKRYRAQKR